jgi:hypothetical protein
MGRGRHTLFRLVLIRVLVFAAIGAAATVLVAWGSVLYGPLVRDERLARVDRWPIAVPAHWPATPNERYVISAAGARYTFDVAWQPGQPEPTYTLEMRSYGSPAGALVLARLHTRGPAGRSDPVIVGRRPLETPLSLVPDWPSWLDQRDWFPTDPLWPGFLVDTAFWGGAAFCVWWSGRGGAGFVRRGVRRRRGRCVGCGYELKGLAVCPECGS